MYNSSMIVAMLTVISDTISAGICGHLYLPRASKIPRYAAMAQLKVGTPFLCAASILLSPGFSPTRRRSVLPETLPVVLPPRLLIQRDRSLRSI